MKRILLFLLLCSPAIAGSWLIGSNPSGTFADIAFVGEGLKADPISVRIRVPAGQVLACEIPDGTYTVIRYSNSGAPSTIGAGVEIKHCVYSVDVGAANGEPLSKYSLGEDPKIPYAVESWAYVTGLVLGCGLAVWAFTRNAFQESLG